MSQVQGRSGEVTADGREEIHPGVVVVGGGLAGCEAAWQAARAGVSVTLFEMRPEKSTEAHRTGQLAELVCSNSFKSDSLENANGLLKLELRMLDSLLVGAALRSRVPAGSALCVDRHRFASAITEAIESHPMITVVRKEMQAVPRDGVTVLAPGPLASAPLAQALEGLVGTRNLFFYDAVSPILETESIDMSQAYSSARYDKGESTYVNLPLGRAEYACFLEELRQAERLAKRDFEETKFFSACMPIEEVAGRGEETLAHGCMKPVGLVDPRTGRIPHAVVQLRPENLEATMYGMVGFQTRLTYGEQERVFRMLPGLERARFVRHGSIHRNTYICGPAVLRPTLEHRTQRGLLLAGQITGGEGYMAAAATGLLAGLNAARAVTGAELVVPPGETMIGGLVRYVSQSSPVDFKPTNPNFGLLPPLRVRVRDRRRRNLVVSQRSVEALRAWMARSGLAEASDRTVRESGVLS